MPFSLVTSDFVAPFGATVRASTRPDDADCDYLAGLRTVIVRLARDDAMRRQSFSSS